MAGAMSPRSVHILIEGHVQGVGFRYWLLQQAERRGVSGWVRNRRTGAVEAMISGTVPVVDDLLAACREGPPAARVDDLYVIADVADPSLATFAGFELRDTC